MAGKIVLNTDEIFSMFCNICCETEIDSLKIINDECSEIKDALILLVGHEDILNKAALYLCKPCRDILTSFMKFKNMCLNNLIRVREMYFNDEFTRHADTKLESSINVINAENIMESNSVVLNNTSKEVSRRSKRIAERKYSVSRIYDDNENAYNCESKKNGAVEDMEEVTRTRTLENLDQETIYISDDEDNKVIDDGSSRVTDVEKCIPKTEMKESEEEIDVVTIDEKHITNLRGRILNLQTNPLFRNHQKLQKTVAPVVRSRRGTISHQLPTMTTIGRKTRLRKRTQYCRYQKDTFGSTSRKIAGYLQYSTNTTRERQRRRDHRTYLHALHVLVPELAFRKRISKVVILLEAAAYCDQLTKESTFYSQEVAELRRQQERLRAHLSQLQQSSAAKS